jgi:2,3-bisphosphoglycerate-independent phosphoglycerate mutase
LPVKIAFPPTVVNKPLGKVISEQGYTQLRMSESEKERFVTFYFNGQNEEIFKNEERMIIPSPKVPTYDKQPEMSAFLLTDELLKRMASKKYDFILLNFANADMVGHTGNIEATIKAIQTLDTCLGKIEKAALELGYTVFITADHGNAEQKINPQTGDISTEHTANPVPFIVIDKEFQGRSVHPHQGILADVAPTILSVMDIPKPAQITGRNLLEEV